MKATKLEDCDFAEIELNDLGYELLGMKQTKEAIRVLELNAAVYPQSANVCDSLGEAYMTNGNRELAIKNYEKSLELDLKDRGAIGMLERLKQK